MSFLDSPWIYIAVPGALIAILILIKINQEKTEEHTDNNESILSPDEIPAFTQPLTPYESTETPDQSGPVTRSIAPQETPTKPIPRADAEAPDSEKPADCQHYMGFLYMRKGPERAQIPTECYQCQKLLRCLYSPTIMEKVYGNGN